MLRMPRREQEAITAYKTALDRVTTASARHQVSGLIMLCRGDYDAARREFEYPALLEPSNASPWRDLGMAYLSAKNFEKAILAFDRALAAGWDDKCALTFCSAVLLAFAHRE